MKNVIIASILGALTMFMWGAISWTILPWHMMTMHSFSNEDAVVAALKAGNAATGTYNIPGMSDNHEAQMAKAKAGPVAMIHNTAEGSEMTPMFFIKGILLDVLIMFIAVSMLSKISWSLATYGNRVRFMMMIGLIIGLAARVGDIIYMHVSTDFSLIFAIDEVVT
jgi:hypothetical protein